MRLSEHEQHTIIGLFSDIFDKQDDLWLFGSRTDDQKIGGDVDLLINAKSNDVEKLFHKKIDFLNELKRLLGDHLEFDIVIKTPQENAPVFEHACTHGIKLR